MKESPNAEPVGGVRGVDDYHSAEEFMSAARALNREEIQRLGLQGQELAVGTGLSGVELLGATIVLGGDGDRRWPRDTPIGAFLYMAMKSTASNARRKDKRLIVMPGEGDGAGKGDAIAIAIDGAPSPETRAILADAEERAYAALEGDELAGYLLMSRIDDQDAADFRAEHGLSAKEYEAVSKRVQRALRRLKRGA